MDGDSEVKGRKCGCCLNEDETRYHAPESVQSSGAPRGQVWLLWQAQEREGQGTKAAMVYSCTGPAQATALEQRSCGSDPWF